MFSMIEALNTITGVQIQEGWRFVFRSRFVPLNVSLKVFFRGIERVAALARKRLQCS